MSARRLCAAALACVSSAVLSAQGSVLVVDLTGGAGSQYTQIQPAVDAALDGDVILVRPGSYQPFVLDGKSVVIAGDPEARVFSVLDGSVVRNVAGSAVLRNLEFGVTGSFVQRNLTIRDCAGSVLVDGCAFRSGDPGLHVVSSAGVTIAASELEGYDWVPGAPGTIGDRNALLAESSSVYAYDSLLAGGDGRDASFPTSPTIGGAAVRVLGGIFLAEACVAIGGAGGDGGAAMFGACFPGADGGSAIALATGAPAAYTTGCSLSSGPGGAGFSPCLPGSSGEIVAVETGTHAALGGWPRITWVASPVREGASVVLEFVSQPGDFVLLLLSSQAAPALSTGLLGSLLPSSSGVLLALGSIVHPSGYRQVTATAGELGPGVASLGLFLQAAFLDLSPAPMLALGPPRHLLLLDQAL